ncbi:ArsR/SmtB family transcription factor [Parerythrobacter lacustris]|uniref:Metalloregulator ArsR/SmtB family transcription factor n=1 Tax=Parerythrobacter lacustris TaxID=2969984 RepID=A0ABT1XVK4_9SPHN|nr:metalloregulator ArsR/SmtB family transcription factor [Parerythrobacter lacustris]MCR2835297.1 metalloregulator ArsR/SmtB family transcription factor [Parerythrobacter lacustris]
MTDDELVDALKALAHPVRLRIMRALTGAERNVGEIDEASGIGQPILSQQLAVLRNAGLVKTRKDAKLVYYRIDDSMLAKVASAAGQLGGLSATSVRQSRHPAPGVANFARLG